MKSSDAGVKGGVFITRRESAPPQIKPASPAIISRNRSRPLTPKAVAAIMSRSTSARKVEKVPATEEGPPPHRR